MDCPRVLGNLRNMRVGGIRAYGLATAARWTADDFCSSSLSLRRQYSGGARACVRLCVYVRVFAFFCERACVCMCVHACVCARLCLSFCAWNWYSLRTIICRIVKDDTIQI